MNKYDGALIYSCIQEDIKKEKNIILLSGISFFFILLVIIPLAFWLFFGLLFFADLPFFNHGLSGMFACTKLFLLPYSILLLFYFVVMYFKNKALHVQNANHFKKATRYFVISITITLLPYIFSSNTFLTVSYFIFFILTIYYLSLTYYDIAYSQAYNIHSRPFSSDDLGWMSSHGMVDNPFTIKDDINRAKVFVQSSTLGFDFIILFMHMIEKSIIFTFGIQNTKNIKETARLFDLLLEDEFNGEYTNFSITSKVLLESLSYVTFQNDTIMLHERGIEVAKLSTIKEQK